jgi:hypothetical protein
MVYVKLLKDVAEGGVEFTGPPLTLKTSTRRIPGSNKMEVTPYVKDEIVTMHEESAKKWIKRGLCQIVKP